LWLTRFRCAIAGKFEKNVTVQMWSQKGVVIFLTADS